VLHEEFTSLLDEIEQTRASLAGHPGFVRAQVRLQFCFDIARDCLHEFTLLGY
jgi:hypothetical protein